MRWTTLARLAAVAGIVSAACGCHFVPAGRRATSAAAMNHYVRGQLLADQGDDAAALAELKAALANDPKLTVAHTTCGDIHRRSGDYGQARASYAKACEIDPYAFRPHYNLGVTYQLLAGAAKAVREVQEHLRDAVNVYLRAVVIEPEDFDTNLNLSACYFQLDKPALAEQYCQAAIACDPERAEAYCNLGVIYDAQGRDSEAIRAYRQSLELDTHQPMLLLNLGSTYLAQRKLAEARHAFETATREAPEMSDAWERLGACLFHQGEIAQAESAFKQAMSLCPDSAPAHRGLGILYMSRFISDRSRTELRDKALTAWRTSLRHDPKQADLAQLLKKYASQTDQERS